jgi:hypothetical protein
MLYRRLPSAERAPIAFASSRHPMSRLAIQDRSISKGCPIIATLTDGYLGISFRSVPSFPRTKIMRPQLKHAASGALAHGGPSASSVVPNRLDTSVNACHRGISRLERISQNSQHTAWHTRAGTHACVLAQTKREPQASSLTAGRDVRRHHTNQFRVG